jgi:hypothetical protein
VQDGFGNWIEYSLKGASFRASEVLESLTWFPVPDEIEAAYDAPFPSRDYMAGVRVFPSLINQMPGLNEDAWSGLTSFERPFLTIWGSNDVGTLGRCETQQKLIDSVPGAAGQPHVRLPEAGHFLQDDQGEAIALRLVEFYDANLKPQPRVGFEILQIASLREIIVWVNSDMTEEEFEAIELPLGWFKNQPREPDPDSGRFLRSPGAAVDGPLAEDDHFGHSWRHNATVVRTGIRMDRKGLLKASRVAKYHELTYRAGRAVHVLISPAGDHYIRVSRDANRTSDTPTLPAGWRLVENILEDDLTLMLPNPTLNIRGDNEDSFQGPVPAEEFGLVDGQPPRFRPIPRGGPGAGRWPGGGDNLRPGPGHGLQAGRWLARHGLPQDADLSLDLNGDGVDLLMAYALDLDPNANQAGRLLTPVIKSRRFGVSFHGANPEIRYIVQASSNLEDWTSEGVEVSDPDAEGRRMAWVERDTPHRFLRLVVEPATGRD